MTHNVKSELRRSMDAIHFSGDDKERMVALLMSAEAPRQRRSGKKLLLLALAATLVVGALTGAAVFTRWARSAQTAYNPPQQVKEQAEKSGLSVMLEDKQEEVAPGGVLSAILYSGKVIGSDEKTEILQWMRSRPLKQCTALVCGFANWADTAPLPCFLLKK